MNQRCGARAGRGLGRNVAEQATHGSKQIAPAHGLGQVSQYPEVHQRVLFIVRSDLLLRGSAYQSV
jgi:hypothetical protein